MKKIILLITTLCIFSGDNHQLKSAYKTVAVKNNTVSLRSASAQTIQSVSQPLIAGYVDRLTFGRASSGSAVAPTSICPNVIPANVASTGIIIQPDHKIVICGYAFDRTGIYRIALVRFLETGALDITFGGEYGATPGTAYVPFSLVTGGGSDYANAVALQPDGKIVVGASAYSTGFANGYFAAARFNSNGTLDTTFGTPGLKAGTVYLNVSISVGGTQDSVNTVMIQPDGKIVLGGLSSSSAGYFAVARLLSNGQTDITFGGFAGPNGGALCPAGTQALPYLIAGGGQDVVHAGVLLSNGNIVLAGEAGSPNAFFGLACFLPNGAVNTNFGGFNGATTGSQFINYMVPGGGGNPNNVPYALTVGPNNQLIAGGFARYNSDVYPAIAQFLENGAVDTTFGGFYNSTPGSQYLPFFIAGDNGDSFKGLVVQSDGKIVGTAVTQSNTGSTVGFARFLPNGALDPNFGTVGNGTTFIPYSLSTLLNENINDVVTGIALQPDGKCVVSVTTNDLVNSYIATARLVGDYGVAPYKKEFPTSGGFY